MALLNLIGGIQRKEAEKQRGAKDIYNLIR